PEDGSPIVLDFGKRNSVQIMDDLVAQRPKYTWSYANGFYDVYPREAKDSLSQVMVKSFSLDRVVFYKVDDTINALPEVRGWLSERKLVRNEAYLGSISPAPKQPLSLDLAHVPFRVILNRLSQECGTQLWTILRRDPSHKISIEYF
ncbi:MAG: hypothetical protein WAM01_12450, partial [Candidatus Acidiferrales bacterium]